MQTEASAAARQGSTGKKLVTAQFPEVLARRLKATAALEGVTVQALLVEAVGELLSKRPDAARSRG